MTRESPQTPADLAVLASARRALRRCGKRGSKFRPVLFSGADNRIGHNRYGCVEVKRLVAVGLLAYGNEARGFAVLTDAGRNAIALDDSSATGIA